MSQVIPDQVINLLNTSFSNKEAPRIVAGSMKLMNINDPLYFIKIVGASKKLKEPNKKAARLLYEIGGHYNQSEIPEKIINATTYELDLKLTFNAEKANFFASYLKNKEGVLSEFPTM